MRHWDYWLFLSQFIINYITKRRLWTVKCKLACIYFKKMFSKLWNLKHYIQATQIICTSSLQKVPRTENLCLSMITSRRIYTYVICTYQNMLCTVFLPPSKVTLNWMNWWLREIDWPESWCTPPAGRPYPHSTQPRYSAHRPPSGFTFLLKEAVKPVYWKTDIALQQIPTGTCHLTLTITAP